MSLLGSIENWLNKACCIGIVGFLGFCRVPYIVSLRALYPYGILEGSFRCPFAASVNDREQN